MDFKPLASFIDRTTEERLPWSEVLVMHLNEVVFRYRSGSIHLKEEGNVDGEPIINIYSMTKIMTCVAALKLVERGLLLLNDPISSYLPSYKEMTVRKQLENGEFQLVRAERPILVRDLFTMTAGFSYDIDSPSIKKVVERTSGSVPTRLFAEALANEPLQFEPGTRWSYSLCHDVLAALIEVVDGRSFGTFIHEEITEPLGMRDTCFKLTENQLNRLAHQYEYDQKLDAIVRNDVNRYRLGTEFESGGAGLYSTVSDYATFLNAITNWGTSTNGVRILAPTTVRLMQSDHLLDSMLKDYQWEPLKGYGYGLGVRTHVSKAESGSLSPIGEMGWSGAGGCMAIIDPQTQLTVMYAQHLLNNPEAYLQPRLRNVVYACL